MLMELIHYKSQVACLEERVAEKEYEYKKLKKLKQYKSENGEIDPELMLKLHTTNVTCFNFGMASVNNQHEIKLEKPERKFLQNAVKDMPNVQA